MALRYQIIDRATGEPAGGKARDWSYVVTRAGEIAEWSEDQGWQVLPPKEAQRYQILVLEATSGALTEDDTREIEAHRAFVAGAS